MPDQPDDARKRQQRGVFPPFFAPRNGRGASSPAPTSGSWRRVSRLFTPPEVPRQHGTAASPQAPSTPTAEVLEASIVPAEPESSSHDAALVSMPEVTPGSTAVVTPEPSVSQTAADGVVAPVEPSGYREESTLETQPEVTAFRTDILEPVAGPPTDDFAWTTSADAEDAGHDQLGRFDPMAFDEGELLVESLEPEPISLAMTDTTTAAPDVGTVATDDAALDDTRYVDSHSMDAEADRVAEADRSDLDDANSDPVRAAAATPWAISGSALDSLVRHEDAPVSEEQTAELDPWAEAELPEPAFGSIGWPSSQIAAPSSGEAAGSVDEMSAALGWSDADAAPGDRSGESEEPGGAAVAGDAALSDVAHELRHSSSAWHSGGDAIVDEDAEGAARARFYTSEEHSRFPSDLAADAEPAEVAAVDEADPGEPASEVGDGTGAAIADALARIAARIRAGEVELPSEAVGASDESALAAALAALLRGPRR